MRGQSFQVVTELREDGENLLSFCYQNVLFVNFLFLQFVCHLTQFFWSFYAVPTILILDLDLVMN
jgi:hypothetical protein